MAFTFSIKVCFLSVGWIHTRPRPKLFLMRTDSLPRSGIII
jgi:hypothetical protein